MAKKGHRKRGYFYRKNRGWCATIGKKALQLYDVNGKALKAKDTPHPVIEECLKRLMLRWINVNPDRASDSISVIELCRSFLDYSKANERDTTYAIRWAYVFDFVMGFPAKHRFAPGKAKSEERIHDGFGKRRACDITPRDIHEWCCAHPGWTSHRMPKQAMKRVFNWATSPEVGILKKNPLAGLSVGPPKTQLSYFTKEQEEAMYENTNPEFAVFLRVLIRTGARPGELRVITAKHLEKQSGGLVLKLGTNEHKSGYTGKDRIIRLPKCIADIVESLAKTYPEGCLFRTKHGEAWKLTTVQASFGYLKKKLSEQGVDLGKNASTYTCRHTFAKRILGGYWTGKPASIEQLCALMGNSRDIAWKHYGQWCAAYESPLWDAVG